MLHKIIQFSISHKLIIILLTLSIAGFGLYSAFNIPLGAVPDITNNQVQVITTSPNLATQDVEKFITYPIELEMANLPGVEEIRSISKFGLSVVTIVFEENMDTYLPRQLIAEKLGAASDNIPEGFGTPEMGPISTGLGEIYQYILDVKPGYEDKYSITELRSIQDWIVKRALSGIPGVVEVNTWGGYLKQYEIAVNPEQLKKFELTIGDIFVALQSNNDIAGGAYIEKEEQSYFIRGDGLLKSIEDIEAVVVKNIDGVPVRIRDVAKVQFGHANRFGAITANGEGEKVMGQIMMLKDANSNKVIAAVKERVAEVQKILPEGVYINPIIERSELIAKTSFTVFENLILGCLIVFIIVLILLGNLRSGLVIASIIPLSLLFTLAMMYVFGIDANLMSLGALDFGIIIDGAVIIVEFIMIHIMMNKDKIQGSSDKSQIMDKISLEGASKMMNSAIFGQIIILLVFIPVLSLTGVEGKMFRPMALSFSFAVLGAMFFGLTWLPVATSLFLKPEKRTRKNISEHIMDRVYKWYCPVIKWSYDHKKIIFTMAIASLIGTGYLFTRMGGEFVPTLDEGDFVIQPALKTGTSLSRTIEYTTQMEQILINEFPEVDQIVSRIGAAEVPTDPMSMEEIDVIIKLKPKSEWVSADSKEELAGLFKEALSVIPNVEYEFTQPIEMRFNELITGVRSDLAIKIFGEDLDILNNTAKEIKELIEDVPGASDVILEKTVGLPQIKITYNRELIAYYGLNIETVNMYVSAAFGGMAAGSIFEGEKQFDMVVRFEEEFRNDIRNIEQINIALPGGDGQIRLKDIAQIEYTEGPAKISRDNTQRRVVVSVNVRNRDLQSVVEDVQALINANIDLPAGYRIEYGGQFKNLENASNRLMLAVPIALLLIFIFLHFAFKSLKEAVMVFTAVPLATVGGVALLWIRGMPFSISAGVGFIALFGIAVLNGIVLIEYLKELKEEGVTDMRERILKATRGRLRPVILTAAAAALGFLPMAVSTSAGAEVQRPLATVVIGGLITSTMLTMVALPLLYAVWDNIIGIQWRPLKLIKANKKLVILFFLGIGSVFQIQAQENNSDLQKLQKLALQNNITITNSKLELESAERMQKSSFSFDKTYLYYSTDENNIAENGHPLDIWGIEQEFRFPTYYSGKSKLLKSQTRFYSNALNSKEYQIKKEVEQQYFTILYLLNKQAILLRSDSLYAEYEKAAEENFKSGRTSKLDWLNARSQRTQSKTEVLKIKQSIESAYADLQVILNSDSSVNIVFVPLERSEIIIPQINNDPGFIMTQSSIELQKNNLKFERSKILPDINIGYFNGSNTYSPGQNYMGFEIGLKIPLFFQGQRSDIEVQKLQVQIKENNAQQYQFSYTVKLESLLSKAENFNSIINQYEDEELALAEELKKYASESYVNGEIDYFEFIISMNNAYEIELKYYDLIFEYNQIVTEINYLIL
ncbi:MAG: CusA/CzcA family heavy metal efflux RND transporter [Marinilabiliales bacterium]|nr:MAG: CusA/CzcA family heavy metal efflux RND transporter [Marinilabiliales bacterium]